MNGERERGDNIVLASYGVLEQVSSFWRRSVQILNPPTAGKGGDSWDFTEALLDGGFLLFPHLCESERILSCSSTEK